MNFRRGVVVDPGSRSSHAVQVAAKHGLSLDDIHVPLLVRAVYGNFPVKIVALLRNPVDRIKSAYYGLAHYRDVYGDNPEVTNGAPHH